MDDEKKEQVFIIQEPAKEVMFRRLNEIMAIWKNLFISNFCQLLAIWIMLLLQIVSEYSFSIEDYMSNLLAFDIVACATNLSDAYGKDDSKVKEMLPFGTVGVLIIVICFASILYCLSLTYDWETNLQIKKDVIMAFSILFTLIVILISILQAVRR